MDKFPLRLHRHLNRHICRNLNYYNWNHTILLQSNHHRHFSSNELNEATTNNDSAINFEFDYEIRMGMVVQRIEPKTLSKIQSFCNDQCAITKTRQDTAVLIQCTNEDDISIAHLLFREYFLEHKTVIDSGDKTKFIPGPKQSRIDEWQKETGALIFCHYNSGEVSIYGTQSQVQMGKHKINDFLKRIVYVELGHKLAFVCGKKGAFIEQCKSNYKCEIHSETSGRMIIIADQRIVKRIVHAIGERVAKAPPENELISTVMPFELKNQICKCYNIADVIRLVRNGHSDVNLKNIHDIFFHLSKLRHIEMKKEKQLFYINEFDKFSKNIDGQQRFDDQILMRRKKNRDYMHFMSKFAKKYLDGISDISTIARVIHCFGIFGIKRFAQKMHGNYKEIIYPMFTLKLFELLSQNNCNIQKQIDALILVLHGFASIEPDYDRMDEDMDRILQFMHLHLDTMNGNQLSQILHAFTLNNAFLDKYIAINDGALMNDVWGYLGKEVTYKTNMHNLTHKHVSMILESLSCTHPGLHGNYSDMNANEVNIKQSVIYLCSELFFNHESIAMEHSIPIIINLSYLGFYDETLFDFLLQIDKLTHIDFNDSELFNKASIHEMLYCFGKTLHMTNPYILQKLCKLLLQYRSTFTFEQYIDCVWALFCLHFYSNEAVINGENDDDDDRFVLSRKQMDELVKKMIGRVQDSDVAYTTMEMAVKLLQINMICSIMKIDNIGMIPSQYQAMLKDGVQSELYNNNTHTNHEYNAKVMNCINQILYGENVESDTFLMKNKYELSNNRGGSGNRGNMQFDFVEGHGMVVDLCIDYSQKRGIMIFGANDVFIDNPHKLCGEMHLNHSILKDYLNWNLCCLYEMEHQTEMEIIKVLKPWFDEHRIKAHKRVESLEQ